MSGSIKDRMAAQLEFLEKQLWNTFLHSGEDMIPYLSKNYFGDHDAAIILWDGLVLDGKDIESYFTKQYGITTTKWMSYEMANVNVIEVDMMAGVVYYGILATRIENGKMKQYKLACSSTWRQNADAEYTLSAHQQTRIL